MSQDEILESLKTINYDLLNQYMMDSVNSSNENFKKSLPYFKDIIRFANIILTDLSFWDFDKDVKYSMYISPQRVIDLSNEFFKSLSWDYSNRFLNILVDGTVSIKIYDGGENPRNNVDKKGKIHLVFEGSVRDVRSTVHEMIHKFSTPYDQMSLFRFSLAESTSLTSEFFLYSFFHEKNIFPEKDLMNFIILDFSVLSKHAVVLKGEYNLYKLFIKNGSIDLNVLFEHVLKSNKPKNYLQTLSVVLTKINRYGELFYFRSFRYIIGFLIACGFYSRMLNGEDVLSDFETLVHLLGEPNWKNKDSLRILQGLDIPLLKENIDVDRVTDDYHKVMSLFKDRWNNHNS